MCAKNTTIKKSLTSLVIAFITGLSQLSSADDLEIFVNNTILQNSQPNVLMILDNSGSMDIIDTGQTLSRMQIVKQVTNNLINDLVSDGTRVNVGLMAFNNYPGSFNGTLNDGGYILYPVVDVASNQSALTTAVNSLEDFPDDFRFTPLAETYMEVVRYFKGDTPVTGTTAASGGVNSHPASISGGNYISPITDACAKNNVVYLTDGLPTFDFSADTTINPLLDDEPAVLDTSCTHNAVLGVGGERHPTDSCLDEIVDYAHEHDFYADGDSFENTQNLTTYIVGFNVDGALLDNSAEKGGTGAAYSATNAAQLKNVFRDIFTAVTDINSSFVAPAIPVDTTTGTTNRKETFLALYNPSLGAHWDGNVKKYGLKLDSTLSNITLIDKNGANAIDTNPQSTEFGQIKQDSTAAYSYWTPDNAATDTPDGPDAARGGVVQHIFQDDTGSGLPNADTRLIYTNTDDGNTENLIDPVNVLHESNARITTAVNGLPANTGGSITKEFFGFNSAAAVGATDYISDEDFIDLVIWARGAEKSVIINDGGDPNNLSNNIYAGREQMGAPIHSRPMVVNYANPSSATTNDVMFVTTTNGYLHAFDADVNKDTVNQQLELFAFVPQELLRNISRIKEDADSDDLVYGLDGEMTVFKNDEDNDGIDPGDPDDYVILVFGQRRGGANYYAVDVTDVSNPELLWTIRGTGSADVVNDPNIVTPGFAELGQSWSRPTPGQIAFGSGVRDILVFAGGYDENQDGQFDINGIYTSPIPAGSDTVGRGIFIVDAFTGELLWSGGPSGSSGSHHDVFSDMNYSIPSDVRVLDLNGDGIINRLMVGDMGGQLWRFDIDNSGPGALEDRIDGGVVAELGGGGAAKRRFFYPPEVGLMSGSSGLGPYLAITMGSGYRAHPLDEVVSDEFYMIRDHDTNPITLDYSDTNRPIISESDLFDISNILPGDLTEAQQGQLASLSGWRLTLPKTGEKVLAKALIVQGMVQFTTFAPPTVLNNGQCGIQFGTGRLYAVNVSDGAPVDDFAPDRFADLPSRGIPSQPSVTVIHTEDGTGVEGESGSGLTGEKVKLKLQTINTSYWYQKNVN